MVKLTPRGIWNQCMPHPGATIFFPEGIRIRTEVVPYAWPTWTMGDLNVSCYSHSRALQALQVIRTLSPHIFPETPVCGWSGITYIEAYWGWKMIVRSLIPSVHLWKLVIKVIKTSGYRSTLICTNISAIYHRFIVVFSNIEVRKQGSHNHYAAHAVNYPGSIRKINWTEFEYMDNSMHYCPYAPCPPT